MHSYILRHAHTDTHIHSHTQAYALVVEGSERHSTHPIIYLHYDEVIEYIHYIHKVYYVVMVYYRRTYYTYMQLWTTTPL